MERENRSHAGLFSDQDQICPERRQIVEVNDIRPVDSND
jgi:hypothetical protein